MSTDKLIDPINYMGRLLLKPFLIFLLLPRFSLRLIGLIDFVHNYQIPAKPLPSWVNLREQNIWAEKVSNSLEKHYCSREKEHFICLCRSVCAKYYTRGESKKIKVKSNRYTRLSAEFRH